ncbi:unnamed protein product [Allacma fusca]|uniref:Chorein N-terminal domain-containing protein n=1 Tax=Allacma fusca TaxID=39272 RepID=A0A8J2NTY2_9HEXA|nr:unnamed protein product [Allacma fusca]
MFKIESYITPYILAYLDKYFKNFNPANFQVSLWAGGASFNNLDLNLEVLEEEFHLPVTFVSGHIHELRIFVPWTKITSEPIVVHVNTIEITLKLKSNKDEGSGEGRTSKNLRDRVKTGKEPEEPPGYVQNLINKMITNIRIDCQNVIVKLVEEDIVFTLNVKTASLFPTNGNWKSSFIDLLAPEFTLRRQLTFSDLTVCLDQTNSAGKIEQYLEPLLYRCSFDVRILQKYHSQFAIRPYFTRMDIYFEEMKFTITDEQIPMLLKLYNMILAVKNSLNTPPAIADSLSTACVGDKIAGDSEVLCEEEDDQAMNWGTWAIGWIPDIPATIFGAVEAEDEMGEFDVPETTSHLGFYVNKASIVFKGMEAVTERKNTRGAPRVKFQPFLKCFIQGIICDIVQRTLDTNVFAGISQILIDGVQSCPCGMKDCVEDNLAESSSNHYLRIGQLNRDFANSGLFEDCFEVKPPSDSIFQFENRVEVLTEEMMLNRAPAVAVEYLDVTGDRNEDSKSHHSSGSTDGYDLGRDKMLCRLVVAPCTVKLCSGSIHRLKMILFSANQSSYEPVGSQKIYEMKHDHGDVDSSHLVDFSAIRNIESAFNIYQFTIFRPYIEIIAGDHLDFDQQTHIRAKYKKRKATTITPLSEVLPEWPKIIVTFSCIDGRIMDPNSRFRKIVAKAQQVPNNVLDMFAYKLTAKVFSGEAKLRSDKFVVPICIPFNLEFSFSSCEKPDAISSNFNPVSRLEISLDDFRINVAKPHLMLLQVILISCYDERISEHLTSTTILRDLPGYNQGDIVIHISEFSIQAVFTQVLHTVRTRVGSLGIFIHSPNYPSPIPIFEGPPNNKPDPEGLAVVILQYPLKLLDYFASTDCVNIEGMEVSNKANEMTPMIIVNISEFLVQFEPVFFQWLSYHPRQMPSSIPAEIQSSTQIVYPMIPVSRTSSRMSVVSKIQSSWSASDENNAIGSVTGEDFQQLYQTPKPTVQLENRSIHESSHHSYEVFDRGSDKLRRKSTLEEEFQLRFAPRSYIETWNKWIVTHLAVIMKSFIIVNIGQGDFWFPVGQQSFVSFSEEKNTNGVLLITPKVVALPEGPKVQAVYSQLPLPLSLPLEYNGRELYPLRITAENFTLSTIHTKEGKQPFSLPLNILLTLTLTEKKSEGKPCVIAAFLHSDIPAVKLSLSFAQINLLLRLTEQFLQTTAIILRHSGSLMLGAINSNNEIEVQNADSEDMEKRRIDPTSVIASGKGKEVLAKQHQCQENMSLSELEQQNFTESVTSSQKQGLLTSEGALQQEAKTSFWIQVTLAQFQLIIINSPISNNTIVDQLVLELEDIVSSLDIQPVFVKWALKVGNVSLRRYERTSQDRWDVGNCVGIVMSSGDEITKDINILKGSRKRQNSLSFSASGSASPIHGPKVVKPSSIVTHPLSKNRGILTFTYTQVQTKNFHKKSEMYSPVARWNAAINKYCEKNKQVYDPYDNENNRYLSEFDMKFGSLDFLVDVSNIHPILKILNAVGSIKFIDWDIPVTVMPYYSNTTLPLIYLETGNVRLFFKTTLTPNSRTDTPDVLALQVSSLTIHSQSENPLTRTIVNKDLYRLAEHTNILSVPGSPVEDRQYQLELVDVLVYTCHWNTLKANSRELLPKPTSTILKTMGENPALEWNTIRSDSVTEEVIGHPILERLDLGIAFAPAIVYEGKLEDIGKHVVVAGHSLELNATSEVCLYANLHQIACIHGISSDLTNILSDCTLGSMVESKEEVVAFNFFQESDSGIDSIVTTFSANDHIFQVPNRKSSEILNMVKEGGFSQVTTKQTEAVPFDLLVTGSMFQVMTYDLKYKHASSKGKTKSSIVAIVPLAFCVFGQPHLVLSISDTSQRAEISIFELFIGFAPAEKRTVHQFSLPDINDFPDRLFECTRGERDPKTGMVPAFVTAKFMDFMTKPTEFSCDVARPLKISLSRRIIKNWLRIQSYFDSINWKENNIMRSNDMAFKSEEPRKKYEQPLMGLLSSGKISLNQVVFAVTEEVEEDLPHSSAALSFSGCTMLIRSRMKNAPIDREEQVNPDNAYVEADLRSITLTSGIGARRDVIMTPWNLQMKARIRWKPWRLSPNITASFTADPVSLHLGPQNLLAFLQLYQTFGNYLLDFIAHQEEKIEKIMHVAPGEEIFPAEDYQDDLRSGSFRYVRKESSSELPEVYQIAFCEADRTMTWRYPHKRCLTRVESLPVPIDSDLLPSIKNKELPCIVEYFDDAQNRFCHYSVIYISEYSRGSMRIPEKEKWHLYTSTVWRVVLEAPLNEADSFNLVKPDILAASLRVDSLQDASLNPRLKLYFDFPKISVHFVNQLTYSGKTPCNLLKSYSFGGLTLPDQPFATLELNTNTLLVSLWLLKCKLDYNSYLKFSVTEYSYLTDVPVMEPFTFQLMFHLHQKSANENKTSVKLQMSTKPITFKLSSAVLHTLTASLITWLQVLETYDGYVVDFNSFQTKKLIHLSEILICNDLHADILVNQIKSEDSKASVNSETFQSIGCRECFSFVWPTHKATSTCKISVRDPDWKASDVVSFHKKGHKVLNVAKSTHKLFVNVSPFSSCQTLVSISGPFSVLNALDDEIEIALLPKSGGREVTWPVQSRNHGPSRLIQVQDIEHFRFRFIDDTETMPWSPVVTVEAIKSEKNRCLAIELYKQDINEKIKTFSVWCSMVEETIESSLRSMIVISPFFRVKSSLAVPTKVYNSVGRSSPDEIFELKGEGSEQKIDFIGSHKVVHHLTFQSSPKVSLSTPPIPLVPGGPLTEKCINSRPINEIISDILNSTETNTEYAKKEEHWPYIRDDIAPEVWVTCSQPDTTVEVGFSPWIEGLPTVLIDVKPWALFVNLTDQEISFSTVKDVDNVFGVLPVSVFTPPKIKDPFKLGFSSGGQICWASPLEFTEQKSRTDIHYVNDNGKIPLDCFSRLEIHGMKEICYLTLETRIRRDILVVSIRSTFSIQNKTDAWLLVKGISLHCNKAQGSSDWTDIEDFTLLQPDFTTCGKSKRNAMFSPLLIHSASDLEDIPEDDEASPMKYLALSCGGPWWFVQLMKFDLLFNHMSASDGLLGKRIAVTIPKYSPVTFENGPSNKKAEPVEDASFPIVLSWTAKNGQVWISITTDLYPQLTIFNLTSKSLFCAQPSSIVSIPISETENFDQYSFIPCNTRGYYTFSCAYANFPDMSSDATYSLPCLMIANLPEKPRNIPQTIRDSFGYFHEKNLIFSGVFEWSKPIRVDGPVQSVQIVDIFGVKVTIEQIGMRRIVYIENLSSVEVSAKDIRHRISGYRIGDTASNNTLIGYEKKSEIERKSPPLDVVVETELSDISVKTRSVGVMATEEMIYLPSEFVIYVPWFRLIVMDKVNKHGGQQEILSLCFQDVLVEKFSEVKHIKLRSLGNEEMRNWVFRACIGDIEINTPPFEDRKSDFAVILRQDGGYIPLCATHEGLDVFSDPPLNLSGKMMLVASATFGPTTDNRQELQTMNVTLEPIEIFVERHLIENVIPIVEDVLCVLDDRAPELSRMSTLPVFVNESRSFQEGGTSQKSRQQLWNLENLASKGNLQELDAIFPGVNNCGAIKRSQIITLQSDLNEINEEIKESRIIKVKESKVVRLDVHDQSRSLPPAGSRGKKGSGNKATKYSGVDQGSNTSGKSLNDNVLDDQAVQLKEMDGISNDSKSRIISVQQIRTWDSDTSVVPAEISHLRDHIQKIFIKSPPDVDSVLHEFAEPLRLQQIQISSLKIYGTVRFKYGMYLAFDRAPVDINEFIRNSIITTHYGMGHSLGQHYWQSIIYGYKNMVTGVGSWEGVGSPTRLVGEVSTGLRDLVVYPYQGIFKGPTGFFVGIGKGCSSMVKHIAAGTLSSVTNGAWTWSRNLDALTQDDEDRRADVHGVTDGITQGFASLGVRMLGAVGGIAHYPIQSIIQGGPSPKNIAAGVAKGVMSVVTKPVGGALELLAMTGEGILKGTGWSNDNQTRFRPISEDIQNANNSALKYYTKTIREEFEQRVLLIIDASQPEPTNTSLHPTTLVMTTENIYVFNTALDEMTLQFPICRLVVAPCQDRNLLCLRIVNLKKPDDYSVAEERVIEFVRGFASAHSLAGTEETLISTSHFTTQIPVKSSKSNDSL